MVDYPENWPEIAESVKAQKNFRCERCGKKHNVKTHHVLTVHHLDLNPSNCAAWNLAVLCQRCHLAVQQTLVWSRITEPYLFDPYPDWLKPHVDAYLKKRRNHESKNSV